MKNILCIGAGYVGGPTMAMIAKKCPDYKVVVVDINAERIAAWQSENLPIFEPGLKDLIKETLNKNLFFSTDVAGNIDKADIIFVSVNTPTKTFGLIQKVKPENSHPDCTPTPQLMLLIKTVILMTKKQHISQL